MDDHFFEQRQAPGSSISHLGRTDTVKPRLLDQVRDSIRTVYGAGLR